VVRRGRRWYVNSDSFTDCTMTTTSGWQVFDAMRPVLTCTYSFGPGDANALAVGGKDGLLVFSPPCRIPAQVFDELQSYGPVRALVATNAFHHLGIPKWKARFPDAQVFAPAQAVARVSQKTGLAVRPLAEAAEIAGGGLDLVDMPHYKTGELLLKIDTPRGLAWYVTDVIMNLRELPANPIARIMFKLSRSAPGLRFNNIAPVFMMSDKRALRRWLADEWLKSPPRWLIPAHGEVADMSGPQAARALFAQ